jgi:hypothetical protein
MIDVGRKVVTHQVKGFLGAQTVYFLLNFNLAHRQIWITRHVRNLFSLFKIGIKGSALTEFFRANPPTMCLVKLEEMPP